MVSPVCPSRESITLSSMLAQKGHFTREVLLMLGRISEIRYQKSGEKRRQGAEQSDRGGNGGRSPRRPAATEANPRTGLKTGHYNGKPKNRSKDRPLQRQTQERTASEGGPYNSNPKSTVRNDCATRQTQEPVPQGGTGHYKFSERRFRRRSVRPRAGSCGANRQATILHGTGWARRPACTKQTWPAKAPSQQQLPLPVLLHTNA